MIIYTVILILLTFLAIGIAFGEENENNFINNILSLFLYLPIYGRIFGWW